MSEREISQEAAHQMLVTLHMIRGYLLAAPRGEADVDAMMSYVADAIEAAETDGDDD